MKDKMTLDEMVTDSYCKTICDSESKPKCYENHKLSLIGSGFHSCSIIKLFRKVAEQYALENVVMDADKMFNIIREELQDADVNGFHEISERVESAIMDANPIKLKDKSK